MKKTKTIIIALMLLSIATSGCTTNTGKPLENITVILKWSHQSQFAGIYVASEKGYYKDQGLAVKIIQYSPTADPLRDVAHGKAEFGITGADQVISAREKGLAVKAVAVIYQRNPAVIYSLKSARITRPQELIGKKLGAIPGTNVNTLYPILMTLLGLNRSQVIELNMSTGLDMILNRTVDCAMGYSINQPQLLAAEGYETDLIQFAEYGVDVYADSIVTSDVVLADNPELVKKFLKATTDGWRYALENQEEAVNYTMKYAPNSNKLYQEGMLLESAAFIKAESTPIGNMEDAKWEQLDELMFNQHIIGKDFDYRQAYDKSLIGEVYGNQ